MDSIWFQGREIRRVFVDEWNDWGAVGIDVAAAVGYVDPNRAIANILERNPNDFAGDSRIAKLAGRDGKRRQHKILSRKGMKKFGMLADTEPAVLFRDWVAQFLTDIEDGRLQVAPGPNADPAYLAERVQGREEVITATKESNAGIAEAGGEFYHHIQLQVTISKRFHLLTPKKFKQRHGLPNSAAVADYEAPVLLIARSSICHLVRAKQKRGQITRDNLYPEMKRITNRIASVYEEELGCRLCDVPIEGSIRPQLQAARKKLLPPPTHEQARLFS